MSLVVGDPLDTPDRCGDIDGGDIDGGGGGGGGVEGVARGEELGVARSVFVDRLRIALANSDASTDSRALFVLGSCSFVPMCRRFAGLESPCGSGVLAEDEIDRGSNCPMAIE